MMKDRFQRTVDYLRATRVTRHGDSEAIASCLSLK